MALLDYSEYNFEPVKGRVRREGPFISLDERTISFSKKTWTTLGEPDYVYMKIDKEHMALAFGKAYKDDDYAIPVYKVKKNDSYTDFRITLKEYVNQVRILVETTHKHDEALQRRMRAYGRYFFENKEMVFDLSNLE